MKKHRIKYIIVSVLLIGIIGAYIGFNFFNIDSPITEGDASGDSTTAQIPDIPNLDVEDDESKVVDDLPTNPIDLINYSLKLYNNGKGSSSTYTYDVNCSADVKFGPINLPIKCKLSQHMDGNLYRNGDECLEEDYFYYDGINPSSILGFSLDKVLEDYGAIKKGYRAIYLNEQAGSVVGVETKDSDHKTQTHDLTKNATREQYPLDVGRDRYVWILADKFPLDINSNTVIFKGNDQTENKKYYKITVDYIINKNDKPVLPDKFRDYYSSITKLERVNFSKYSFTFYIKRTTGELLKLVKEEKFTCTMQVDVSLYGNTYKMPLLLSGSSTYAQTFTKMNEEVVLPRPQLEYVG